MSEHKERTKGSAMEKLAAFIVDKRSLFFLLVVLGIVFSCFSQSWVEVENDLTAFLPDDSETSRGLAVMEEQFTTYGTAQVMIANIDPVEAQAVADLLGDLKGVQSVAYDETDQHYNNISALYDVTFDYDEDDACLDALELVKTELAGYDLYVSTELGNALSETIDAEVSVIMVVVAIIVVAVLLFVCDTVAEVPVLLLTFLTAMILNSGTNFLLGKISFVSNSVTSILQLALSLDYAIIFSNHFKEEHETLPLREAAIAGVGENLGRGTVTSIILVLFVLPQILLIGGTIVDKTSFKVPSAIRRREGRGRVRVEGMVYGRIEGTISGTVNAIVDGDVDVNLISGTVEELNEEEGGREDEEA